MKFWPLLGLLGGATLVGSTGYLSYDLRTFQRTVLTQLEDDLRRAWPNRLLGLEQSPIRFVAEGELVHVEILREAAAGGPAPLQRVVWQIRSGALERGFSGWPPAAGSADAVRVPFFFF